MSAEGMGNQLGRPALDRLAVLVRESVQNSWDARNTDYDPVRFEIDAHRLNSSQRQYLAETVLGDRPPGPAATHFEGTLDAADHIEALVIRDTGTSGLGGPTRADAVPRPGQSTDFVDFIRNVGQAPNKQLGGGTYGYGKAILYRASRMGTICVYTRSREGRSLESRFIACAWGMHFDITRGGNKGRYTGRHWWGRRSLDAVVDPLLDAEADQIATNLGIPLFGEPETGTCIMIVAPQFGDRSSETAMAFIAESLQWHCWPKAMHAEGAKPAMQFVVRHAGVDIEVPSPQELEPLIHFATAKTAVLGTREGLSPNAPTVVSEIRCGRPHKLLGHLALTRFASRPWSGQLASPDAPPLTRPIHHVALMRNAELVVKYLEGPPSPIGDLEYCGVFIPIAEADEAFAKAEPPTHDDWQPNEMDSGHQKTFVRVALRRIQDAVHEFVTPRDVTTPSAQQATLGSISDSLGLLVAGQDNFGPGLAGERPPRPTPAGVDGRGSRRPRTTTVTQGQPELLLRDGTLALAFPFTVIRRTTKGTLSVSAVPRIGVLDTATIETDAPLGTVPPRVLGWETDGDSWTPGTDLIDSEGRDVSGRVFVEASPDAAVGVDFVVVEI